MLSRQTFNGTLTPGRHQRQNSTPTKLDSPKNVSPVTHRRGLSTDQVLYTERNHGLPQRDFTCEGIGYTLGRQLTQTAPMQETQQQFMARPGLNPQTFFEDSKPMPRLEHDMEDFTNDYITTPTTGLDNQTRHSLPETYNFNTLDFLQFDSTASAGNLDGLGKGLDGREDVLPNYTVDTKVFPLGMRSPARSRPSSREGIQQPCTPPSQMRSSYFPMTPATTPYSEIRDITHGRTLESSPTQRDPNLTIKASHEMQRGVSWQDGFSASTQNVMTPNLPSPAHTAPLELRRSLDLAPFPQPSLFNMVSLTTDMPTWEGGYDPSNYSPVSNAVSSVVSSFQSSPEMAHTSLLETQGEENDSPVVASFNMSRLPASQSTSDLETYTFDFKDDSQPRSQSMSQIPDENECIEETGVTSDEISAFISDPDTDNKWKCLYPNCGKLSPRKENIKAHVQTHLDDRQFRCKDCNKRFVRQHDLKRHTNIHSRKRNYLCPCGKDFARHDALTRHRLRNCCVGGFDGIMKKVMKRGRPKKCRPEAEDRLEKSAATRQRALEKLEKRSPGKYASSVSDSSFSAYPSPEQYDSPPEQVSSPPELDVYSSSPLATSRAPEAEGSLSQSMAGGLPSQDEFYNPDFDLSRSLEKYVAHKDINEALFQDFLSEEMEGAATLNDFDYPNDV